MSNKCSVYILQGTVDDSSLNVFGDFKVNFVPQNDAVSIIHVIISPTLGDSLKITTDSLTYFTNSDDTTNDGQEKTISSRTDVYIKINESTNFNVIVNSRYALKEWVSTQQVVNYIGCSLDEISYFPLEKFYSMYGEFSGDLADMVNKPICDTIKVFRSERFNTLTDPDNFTGDIQSLSSMTSAWTEIMISNHSKVNGDISAFAECEDLKYLNLSGTKCSGTITSLGTNTKLTTFLFSGTQINGSIEDFVSAQRAAGRASCSGIGLKCNKHVTYQGSVFGDWINKTLSWDAVGNITVT